MNVNRIKGKIVERGMNIAKVAERMGIDRATLYRKLNTEGATMTVRDAKKLTVILELSSDEASSIFFGNNVAYCAKREVD